MSERDAQIAPTAHYTAYVWSRLKLPYAEHFATTRGRLIFWSARLAGEWVASVVPRLPSMTQYLELRHRTIERALLAHAPDVIVEIGAGLSRRGVTWASDEGVRYVEIDLPAMIAAKRAAIDALPPPIRKRLGDRLQLVSCDILADDFAHQLAKHLAGARRPAIVAEGVMGYFPEDERLRIARSIHSAFAAESSRTSIFLCDLRAREGGLGVALAAKLLKGGIRVLTRGRGAREDFANAAAIESFFSAAGYRTSAPVAPQLPHLAHLRAPMKVWQATL